MTVNEETGIDDTLLTHVPDYWKKNWLYEKYHEEKYTLEEIAEMHDVSIRTITNHMDKHGIERRAGKIPMPYVPLKTGTRGYERWQSHEDGETVNVSVHQLLAIANGADPHVVFDPNTHIHHENEIPWDNRDENLRVMSIYDHLKYHRDKRD